MANPLLAARYLRRLAPAAQAAYRHWQNMSPEEKARYREKARSFADRGRGAASQGAEAMRRAQQRRRGGGGGAV